MTTIELQQVRCPNCGANISQFNKFRQTVECPYCHSILKNPNAIAEQKSMPVPDRIIPFTTKDNDFGMHLIKALIRRNYVPTDIFDYLKPGDVIKAYLPMFLFEGTYRAPWNGKVVNTRKEGENTVRDTRYVNGEATGNFQFMCLAYEGTDIPEELCNFARVAPYNVNDTQQYSPSIIGNDGEDITTISMNADRDLIWARRGEEELKRIVDEGVHRSAGSSVESLDYNYSTEMRSNGRLVLMPYWFIYYDYQGTRYHFMMDGLGRSESLTAPVDKGQKDDVNQYNWTMWLTLIVLIIGLILKFAAKVEFAGAVIAAGGVAFVAALLIYIFRRRSILKAAKRSRDLGAARFLQRNG